MKNRVLTFIIGVLVGAILATIGFNIYSKSIMNNRGMMKPGMSMNERGNPPERPNGAGRGEMRENRQFSSNNETLVETNN